MKCVKGLQVTFNLFNVISRSHISKQCLSPKPLIVGQNLTLFLNRSTDYLEIWHRHVFWDTKEASFSFLAQLFPKENTEIIKSPCCPSSVVRPSVRPSSVVTRATAAIIAKFGQNVSFGYISGPFFHFSKIWNFGFFTIFFRFR